MQLSLFQETHEPDTEALRRILRADAVAIDVETDTRYPGTGPKLDYGLSYQADVTVIGLAWAEGGELKCTGLAAPFDASIRDFLKTLFNTKMMVAHNAVFDFRQLSRLTGGQIPARIWDTQTMARLLHPAIDVSYSLIGVASMLRLAVPERQQALKGQRSKLHLLPLDVKLQYAQDDARLTLEIFYRQRALPGSSMELIDWECRAVREYCRMAADGIRLNTPFVEQRLKELTGQRDELAARLRLDGLLTPGSSRAKAKYLYETKGIPLPEWNPKSWYFTRAGRHRLMDNPGAKVELTDLSTRSGVIESYLEEGSPYYDRLKDLAAYSEVDWLISTMQGLIDHAALDGRLHSLVSIATESGRRASSYPHMQNWKMPAMAGVAIGDEGFTLVEIDYSNAENVMAAMISGDSNLAAACAAEDFHAVMSAQYFGEAWEKSEGAQRKHLRTMSKKITYGTAYGMGAERLGESIGVSKEEAQRLIRAKDAAFAKVTRMRTQAQQQVRETHLLKLWTGRPVAVPTPFVAWNYLCQGGVSEMLKRAIVVVAETYAERNLRSRVALDMHDALILEVAHDEWEVALKLAAHIMSHITPENLTEATHPPIHWNASPDPEENRHKWGAEQWHPELP